MEMLSIFKKDSGSPKNLFLEAGSNKEYFVFVKFSDNFFVLNETNILLNSQLISETRPSTFMPEIKKLVSWANMTGLSFSEHL